MQCCGYSDCQASPQLCDFSSITKRYHHFRAMSDNFQHSFRAKMCHRTQMLMYLSNYQFGLFSSSFFLALTTSVAGLLVSVSCRHPTLHTSLRSRTTRMQIMTRLCSSTSFDRFSGSRTFGQGFKGSGNMAIGVSRSGSVIPSKEFVCFFPPTDD